MIDEPDTPREWQDKGRVIREDWGQIRLDGLWAYCRSDHDYLVVDDYGTGGIWAVIRAPSKAVVEKNYPDLGVFDEWPAWVDETEYARIKAKSGFRFDQPDDYWTRFYQPA
jgi:hypothetical protein